MKFADPWCPYFIDESLMTIPPVLKLTEPVADSSDPATFASRANRNFLQLNSVLDSINTSVTSMNGAIEDINTDVADILASALLADDVPDPVGYGDYFVGANSGETGLTFVAHKSAASGGFRNKVINGQIAVNQRGEVSYSDPGYTVDMWELFEGVDQACVVAPTAYSGTEVPNNPPNSLYFKAAISTIVNSCWVQNKIEDVKTLSGKTATVTFYAYSNATGLTFDLNVIQDFGSGGSTAVSILALDEQALTDTWAKYTAVVSIPSVAGKTIGADNCLILRFKRAAYHTFHSGIMYITNLSLVEGDATFEEDPGQWRPYSQELSMCQRYYLHNRKVAASGSASAAGQDSACFMSENFPVSMRDIPNVTFTEVSSTNVGTDPKTSGTAFSVDETGFAASPRSVASGRTHWRGTYTASAEI